MSSHILVTAAIIENAGKYLITQRLKNEKSFPDLWEFPGGKVKPCEELRACLEREILEELGIEIKAGDVFGKASYNNDEDTHIKIVGFYCDYISREIQHIEVQGHEWAYPNEMENYDFCPADLFFIEKLNRL